MDTDFLTTNEAAELLKVAKWNLRNWTKSGKITAYKKGSTNKSLFKRSDIEALSVLHPQPG